MIVIYTQDNTIIRDNADAARGDLTSLYGEKLGAHDTHDPVKSAAETPEVVRGYIPFRYGTHDPVRWAAKGSKVVRGYVPFIYGTLDSPRWAAETPVRSSDGCGLYSSVPWRYETVLG